MQVRWLVPILHVLHTTRDEPVPLSWYDILNDAKKIGCTLFCSLGQDGTGLLLKFRFCLDWHRLLLLPEQRALSDCQQIGLWCALL